MFSAVSTRNPHTQEPGIHALSVSTDVQDVSHVNVNAAQGVAIREFPLKAG